MSRNKTQDNTHKDESATIPEVIEDAPTRRKVYEHIQDQRALLLRAARDCERLMDWLKRKT